jgi:hypothetical protein
VAADRNASDREDDQETVIAESEALKLRLIAHAASLELFVATFKRRDDERATGENGRVD